MYADLRISQSSLGTGSEGMDSGAEARWPQGLKRTHYVRTGLSGDKSSLAVAGRNQNRHIAHAGPFQSASLRKRYTKTWDQAHPSRRGILQPSMGKSTSSQGEGIAARCERQISILAG